MAELEKVIAGLESCRPGRSCDGCPYHELFMKGRCNKQMEEDALVLLKAQEARVVTTADFENNPNLDDGYHLNVWEEYKDGARCGWDTINVNDVRAFTDLRRYWTSRPTPEQMTNTPWEGGE